MVELVLRRGSCPRHAAALRCTTAVVAAVVLASVLCAASDVGAGRGPFGDATVVRYTPPVRAPVVDPFRAPTTPYGPGNRGLEYAPVPGAAVAAIGAGRVAFAGQVAGRLVVSIDHPDGLRSSLVGLVAISARVGEQVVGGRVVGRAGPRLHLGVRRGETYLDPSTLFGVQGPARLVPRRRVPALGPGF